MKKLKFFIAFVTFSCLISNHLFSQSTINRFNDVYYKISNSKDGTILFETDSGSSLEIFSPNGNILKTVSIKIPKYNELLENITWSYIFPVRLEMLVGSETITMIDANAILTKGGNLKIVFHSNGAGNILPRGWDFGF